MPRSSDIHCRLSKRHVKDTHNQTVDNYVLYKRHRPINHEQSRALLLASLAIADAVVIFEEDTPLELIKSILPDVLVKGGDYTLDQIVGATEVISNGGKVIVNPLVDGFSTTGIIQQIKSSYS